MDELESKLSEKESRQKLAKEKEILVQFEDMYNFAVEIKQEQQRVEEHKKQLVCAMNNLQIHEWLIKEMEGLVSREAETQSILKALSQLKEKVCLSEEEGELLRDGAALNKHQQQMGFCVFEKLLTKIEIFEGLKEMQTLKEIPKETPSPGINTINQPSSWWNLSGYFSSEKVSVFKAKQAVESNLSSQMLQKNQEYQMSLYHKKVLGTKLLEYFLENKCYILENKAQAFQMVSCFNKSKFSLRKVGEGITGHFIEKVEGLGVWTATQSAFSCRAFSEGCTLLMDFFMNLMTKLLQYWAEEHFFKICLERLLFNVSLGWKAFFTRISQVRHFLECKGLSL